MSRRVGSPRVGGGYRGNSPRVGRVNSPRVNNFYGGGYRGGRGYGYGYGYPGYGAGLLGATTGLALGAALGANAYPYYPPAPLRYYEDAYGNIVYY
jgi:hypothetical protein